MQWTVSTDPHGLFLIKLILPSINSPSDVGSLVGASLFSCIIRKANELLPVWIRSNICPSHVDPMQLYTFLIRKQKLVIYAHFLGGTSVKNGVVELLPFSCCAHAALFTLKLNVD